MNTQMPLDLPGTEADLFGFTTCDNASCKRGPFPQSELVAVCKHTGKSTMQLHFCSETCANEYYLERLRSV